MKNKDEESLFHLEYITSEDSDRNLKQRISELTDEDKTEFEFHKEFFYHIGRGHMYGRGFFDSYVTKSGIEAMLFRYSRKWKIKGRDYKFKDDEFIELPKVEYIKSEADFSSIQFPIIKNMPKGINFDKIKSVIPMAHRPKKNK